MLMTPGAGETWWSFLVDFSAGMGDDVTAVGQTGTAVAVEAATWWVLIGIVLPM